LEVGQARIGLVRRLFRFYRSVTVGVLEGVRRIRDILRSIHR